MASSLPFYELCQNLDRISTIPKIRDRAKALREFMNEQRKRVEASTDPEERKISLFPIARLLLTHLDRERGAYGIKENNLAQRFIRILGLAKGSADAQKLLNFRAPSSNADIAGDFAAVACHVLQNFVRTSPSSFTVGDINKLLDQLHLHAANKNSSAGIDNVVQTFVKNTSLVEQKWIIRLLLKNCKAGLGKTSIFRSIHYDAEKLFDVCSNLKEVCIKLNKPEVRINEIEITLASPFYPMLAERVDIGAFDKYFSQQHALICETKIDGERIQIHKQGNGQYKYFSRRSIDYTQNFGSSIHSVDGSLTPKLGKCIYDSAITFILDGEMVAYSKVTKSFKYKGQNTDVKYLKPDGDIIPCFNVFDVLYYNGQVLTNKPLSERLKILPTIFREEEGVIVSAKRWNVTTKEDVVKSLNEAIDAMDEGIMIKDPDAVYKPNERNAGWWKVKPEYNNSLMEHLDVLILGGYWGGGGRRGTISQFLLGITNRTEDGETEFQTLCRVGSGYTRDEIGMVMNKLQNYWIDTKPDNVKCVGTEKPDVWIDPKQSIVLEIKASEIVKSGAYYTKFTLRFPRTEKPRFDKDWKDCLSLEQLNTIRFDNSGKLVKQHAKHDTAKNRKKRKVVKREELPLASQFQPADVSDIVKETELFKDKIFCVFTGDGNKISKQEIEKNITLHGGSFVQNPTPNITAVLSHTSENIRVKNLVKQGINGHPNYDIVRISWLLETIKKLKYQLPEPIDTLFSTIETENRFKIRNDKYGDSYTKKLTVKDLKMLFNYWKDDENDQVPTEEEIYEFQELILEGTKFKNIFISYIAYFDQYIDWDSKNDKYDTYDKLECIKFKYQFRGGKVSDVFNPLVINLFVVHINSCNSSHLIKIREKLSCQNMFHIVTIDWISQSLENNTPLPEKDFLPSFNAS